MPINPRDDMAVQQALSQLGAQGPGPGGPGPGAAPPGGMPPEGAMPPGPQQAPGQMVICPNCGHEFPF